MDMMSFMKPDVGLVLQMPYCCTRKGFAAVYEKVSMKTHTVKDILIVSLRRKLHSQLFLVAIFLSIQNIKHLAEYILYTVE